MCTEETPTHTATPVSKSLHAAGVAALQRLLASVCPYVCYQVRPCPKAAMGERGLHNRHQNRTYPLRSELVGALIKISWTAVSKSLNRLPLWTFLATVVAVDTMHHRVRRIMPMIYKMTHPQQSTRHV